MLGGPFTVMGGLSSADSTTPADAVFDVLGDEGNSWNESSNRSVATGNIRTVIEVTESELPGTLLP